MRGRHARAVSPPPPEDRSWAARAAALKREKPAQLAILLAVGAFLAMLAGWIAVLIPPGGNLRFNPVYWLLAAPLLVWLWGVQSSAVWAIRTVWLVLVLTPCLALLALLVAPALQAGPMGGAALGTPLAMLVILGLTTVLAGAGLAALRRSSLPGGTGAVTYGAPEAPADARALSDGARGTLMLGSLPLSGTLVNGVFFAIVATMAPVGPGGTVWPLALAGVAALTVGGLVGRGTFRLARRRAGAAGDLRRGWWLGMGCSIAALAGLWVWPAIMSAKLGLSCFMVPVALGAALGGRAALRDLPAITGERG